MLWFLVTMYVMPRTFVVQEVATIVVTASQTIGLGDAFADGSMRLMLFDVLDVGDNKWPGSDTSVIAAVNFPLYILLRGSPSVDTIVELLRNTKHNNWNANTKGLLGALYAGTMWVPGPCFCGDKGSVRYLVY